MDSRCLMFFRQIDTKGRAKEDVLEVMRVLAMDIVWKLCEFTYTLFFLI